jgi:hypothetical protein
LVFSAAARDQRVAATFDAFGTRCIGPSRAFASMLPRAVADNARHALAQRRGRLVESPA